MDRNVFNTVASQKSCGIFVPLSAKMGHLSFSEICRDAFLANLKSFVFRRFTALVKQRAGPKWAPFSESARRSQLCRRGGTNTIAADCTSQRNTKFNHFGYRVCNSDRNLESDCNSILYQSCDQPILLVEEHRYYSSREDRISSSSS